MGTYAYIIVSKKGRRDDLEKLQSDEQAIADYAAKNSLLINEWVRERNLNRTGSMLSRESAKILRGKLRAGDTLLFPSFGDFASTPDEALRDAKILSEIGIHLHFVDLGGEIFNEHQKILFPIFETFVREGDRRRAIRASSTRMKRSKQGGYKGGVPPYGFRYDKELGKLTEEPWRKKVLQLIATSIGEGMTIRAISTKVKKELKRPISIFTIQRLKETDEVKKMIEVSKNIDDVL